MENLPSVAQIHELALKNLLITFSLCFLSLSAFSQIELATKDKKAISFFEEAMTQYKYSNWANVESFLKQAIERDTNFTEAYLELALFYGEQNNYKDALPALEKVIELNGEKYPESYYYKGLFDLKQGRYDESKIALTKFLKFENQDLKKIENSERMLQKCEFALGAASQQKVAFRPINMGSNINSNYPEYYPCLTADEELLLYTRQIPSNKSMSGINEEFYVSIKRNDDWVKSMNMGQPINTYNNEGAPTLSVDGLLLIFTACPLYGDYGPGRKGFGSCDLFFSQKIGDTWSAPRNLGKPVNSGNWETQPSFASDGRTLYFVRGKNSGYGIQDQDIYQTYLTDTGWTEPVRLPKTINSPGHEESVFIHPDGKTLYFSSDGHPGFGGLDIFVSKKDDEGNWSTPENLGSPINTSRDENSLMVNAKGDVGYFASDRQGGFGGLDLYYFEMPEDKRPEKVTFLKGKVIDAITKQPLLAKFELIDLKTGKAVIESYSNQGNGQFLVCLPPGRDYALNASKDGYLFYSDHFTLTDESERNKPILKDVPLVPIQKGAKVVLNNIFFETNKYDLKSESKVELDKLILFLQNNSKVNVEIGGHTDNTGSKELNIKLSENRAKSVYEYLVQNGIPSDRLSFKGYADNEPIASNESAKGKAKNRRTEFKIIDISL